MNLRPFSTGSSTRDELGLADPHAELERLGLRLRKAMGEQEILPRGNSRIPTYRSTAESLDTCPWIVRCADPAQYRYLVIPYNRSHDGWTALRNRAADRYGPMATAVNPYEYAYEFWDDGLEPPMRELHPDLFDNGTFGVWLETLPQPVSLMFMGHMAQLTWAAREPRVHRSNELGRYNVADRQVTVEGASWRHARALAFVAAWEKMAANEPADRYASILRKEFAQLRR